MNEHFESIILQSTGASSLYEIEIIQELWSGYGQIIRIGLEHAPGIESVIIKHVQLPRSKKHLKKSIGHERKVKSYEVEAEWYKTYSKKSNARLPKCLAIETQKDEVLIVLEDLDGAGFPLRKWSVHWEEISSCLEWLAKFHASYLGKSPDGLWEIGTYWHLDTRPDELEELSDIKLKKAASAIDSKLNNCTFKTFVHGDAKLANFCFAKDNSVSGVDFQYVGSGCGMKDVAYFINSCLSEKECERLEGKILETYFDYLQKEFDVKNEALEEEWRSLYRVAWADFHRFFKGWGSGYWKKSSYSERVTAEVIKNL